jgi:O-antigen/teichoic acid export membrane protein
MTQLKQNVIYKLSEGIINVLASIFQYYVLTHYFTPAQVGNFAFVLSAVMIVKTLTLSHGVLHVLVRQVSQEEASDQKLFSNAFFLRLFLVSLGGVILLPAIYSLEYFSQTKDALMLVLGGFLIYDLFQLSEGYLIGKERVKETALIRSLGQIILVISFGLIVFFQANFFWVFWSYIASLFVSGILFLATSQSYHLVQRRLVKKTALKNLFIQSLPITLMGLLTQLYVRVDVVMLKWFLGEEQVGIYATAYKLLDYLMVLSGMMTIAFFPVLSKLVAKNQEKFQQLYRKNILAYLKIFFPLTILIALIARPLIQIFYGTPYLEAQLSLQILMLAALFAYLNAPSGSILVSLKKQTLYLAGVALSFLVNFSLNLVLIPRLGIEGAAISTVFTEITILTFSAVVIYREIKFLPFIKEQ